MWRGRFRRTSQRTCGEAFPSTTKTLRSADLGVIMQSRFEQHRNQYQNEYLQQLQTCFHNAGIHILGVLTNRSAFTNPSCSVRSRSAQAKPSAVNNCACKNAMDITTGMPMAGLLTSYLSGLCPDQTTAVGDQMEVVEFLFFCSLDVVDFAGPSLKSNSLGHFLDWLLARSRGQASQLVVF